MVETKMIPVVIYTDGSCSTEFLVGAWVAIILAGEDIVRLSGLEMNTTHNRMELMAVIKAFEFIRDHYKEINRITICSDSQYVVGLPARRERIMKFDFSNKKGDALQNSDLLKKIFDLFSLYNVEYKKIKAHQKMNVSNAFNIEADLQSRKMVRAAVKKQFI